ncbi:MAG: hypothetical protein RL177_548, partial [Bacteroidota bacterium]
MSEPKLFASSAELLSLTGTYGTPTYVYSEAMIRHRCARLALAFDGLPVRLLYAVKANDNPHIL